MAHYVNIRNSDYRNYSNIPDEIRSLRYINARIIMVIIGNKHEKVYYIEFQIISRGFERLVTVCPIGECLTTK